ncbi:hypothetical protein [Paeniglutamicibacter terrestris]|uniref:Phage head morphogenesis domain-containing protein n=1 Tax=Paeniglutamicibacter terrestris TaxID=2723403 RepID=A0ABX1G4C7_9MICC|nr:hypothetical protein [Paeniglutamicibacter terrestris]NKG21100.1 hypothetical protein [Paeniglutamicibacter terrestris]
MASARELAQLRDAQAEVVSMVQDLLDSMFWSMTMTDPARVRDALLEFVPLLVDQYGSMSAQIAAEWYDDVVGGSRAAVAAPAVYPVGVTDAKVRFFAGHLFGDTAAPDLALAGISQALGKYVRQSGRNTIISNAEAFGQRWARVPKGAKTCAFCLMLASRSMGWLYESAQSAGDKRQGGEEYHGDCNCEAVVVNTIGDYPEGSIDPQGAYSMYREAWKAAGGSGSSGSEVTYQMRRLFPDLLTDGVIEHIH